MAIFGDKHVNGLIPTSPHIFTSPSFHIPCALKVLLEDDYNIQVLHFFPFVCTPKVPYSNCKSQIHAIYAPSLLSYLQGSTEALYLL
jgi:hypothetical protein